MEDLKDLWIIETTQLKQIQPNVKSTYYYINRTREHMTKLHPPRIGHTQLTHGYLCRGENQPQCQH